MVVRDRYVSIKTYFLAERRARRRMECNGIFLMVLVVGVNGKWQERR